VLHAVATTHGLQTPIGVVGFDANGDTTAPVLSLVRIVGGTPHTVDQITLPSS
jgi:hypothetical protein